MLLVFINSKLNELFPYLYSFYSFDLFNNWSIRCLKILFLSYNRKTKNLKSWIVSSTLYLWCCKSYLYIRIHNWVRGLVLQLVYQLQYPFCIHKRDRDDYQRRPKSDNHIHLYEQSSFDYKDQWDTDMSFHPEGINTLVQN